ncbi:hypothetical protein SOVF_047300 [Spinacia oleracea]|nr:hypothetical protein SOVF_047300 [Spinacia oleracea]
MSNLKRILPKNLRRRFLVRMNFAKTCLIRVDQNRTQRIKPRLQ